MQIWSEVFNNLTIITYAHQMRDITMSGLVENSNQIILIIQRTAKILKEDLWCYYPCPFHKFHVKITHDLDRADDNIWIKLLSRMVITNHLRSPYLSLFPSILTVWYLSLLAQIRCLLHDLFIFALGLVSNDIKRYGCCLWVLYTRNWWKFIVNRGGK